MKEIKIEVPLGYEVDKDNSTFERIVFKEVQKDVMERVKTPKDAIKELGESDEDVIEYRGMQEAGLSSRTLNNQLAVIIVKALNEGWIADWDDSSQYKYFPWFYLGKSFRCNYYFTDYAGSTVPTRLCLKSSKLAEYTGKQFKNVYKEFMN